jgi:serine protease AprX
LLTGLLVSGLIAGGSLAAMPASAEPTLVPLSPSLAGQLVSAISGRIPVMVHGATLVDAQRAVAATGMRQITAFRQIGVVVAAATKQQIEAARTQPGVTYLEGDQPISDDAVPTQVSTRSTSLLATRGLEAQQTLTGANGAALDGSGVSVAIIDSGIDPTHPAFAGGKVVRSLKSVCLDESNTDTNCIVDMPRGVDTDTLSLGGHGSHV